MIKEDGSDCVNNDASVAAASCVMFNNDEVLLGTRAQFILSFKYT